MTLALGIGENTAIFGILDRLLVRPLPVEKPYELVALSFQNERGEGTVFNHPLYLDYRDQNQVFSGLIAYNECALSLTVNGQTERLRGLVVSENCRQSCRHWPKCRD